MTQGTGALHTMSDSAVSISALVVAIVSAGIAIWALTYAGRQTKAAEKSALAAETSALAASGATRIAAIADVNARHGWKIEQKVGSLNRFSLRNTGTFDAYDVDLTGNFLSIGFDQNANRIRVSIPSGQAHTFFVSKSGESSGEDVQIEWQPQSENGSGSAPRQSWIEPLPT
ncbi:hypothetical protein ACWFNS_07510 [Oerskovia enterophila]